MSWWFTLLQGGSVVVANVTTIVVMKVIFRYNDRKKEAKRNEGRSICSCGYPHDVRAVNGKLQPSTEEGSGDE
jgi:hypothetical protein